MAASTTVLEQWALPQLQPLLPLDDESLRQVVQYAASLPKPEAAEHLKGILGDGARALEFISSFNMRRGNAATSANAPAVTASSSAGGASGVPPARGTGGAKKRKKNIHELPARRVEGSGDVSGAYIKSREDEEYIPRASSRPEQQQNARPTHKDTMAQNLALRGGGKATPDATQLPLVTDSAALTTQPITAKPPPSAAGALVSDALAPRSKTSSRNASPSPAKAKVNITGGTAMHGASSALSDLDSAIRSLEIQTNPSLASSDPATAAADKAKRKCNCMATRHPLLDVAPNCLNCGKVICVKEGLGPCTFCSTPLLSADEIAKVLRVLKDERGEERQKANNAAHRKADVAAGGKARAFTGREFLAAQQQQQHSSATASPLSSHPATPTPTSSDDEGTAKAKAHRDKLLAFQAQNARRTQIHDEAADFDVPAGGTSMWASPAERAKQLKRQQRVLREMEWNARPEWEKRRVVASIDLSGKRVVRRMAEGTDG
ncbi:putative zinc finger motif, C2HC5-type-domain-containing protein [Neohortaea acidophila]|uniref:Putative zinc finger motif, C2HC5-type-domain-containing protein n=1 Tax=Neohortaea acidophila TaxID=245834 RepID=A0A6A6PI30_9PEZI|nr:putative zinc finger motif, C2HC5-type-domain-containing protein [Neohortaea acidophila]KAF2479680.1 putative zinc finger motif, C2HC5-type-domain-containing protein [Neohortaea acidophila]